MALPSSGTLSLAQIQTEFGGSNPISLNEYYRGGAYVTANNTNVPTSGSISISNFYGAVNQFAFTISSAQTNANLRTLAINAGWDQSSALLVTINSGVAITSTNTATPALTISGSFPAGVVLNTAGNIIGRGGDGGLGGTSGSYPAAGGAGGTALSVLSAVTINNSGIIGGGGGGGGGASPIYDGSQAPGGGGGAGFGAAGGNGNRPTQFMEQLSTAGGLLTAGTGGWYTLEQGGNGGGNGVAGVNGNEGAYYPNFAVGGAGGAAVTGNSNITWTAFGTRYGSVS